MRRNDARGRRHRAAAYGPLVAVLLAAGPGELASETLTLSTYYPAPLGVYRELVTTGAGSANTLLARDGGNVGIGLPSPSYKLDVQGTAGLPRTYLKDSEIYFSNTAHDHSGLGNTAGYAAIENASNYNTLMILGRTTSTSPLVRSVSIWDTLTVNGSQTVNGTLQVTSTLQVGGVATFQNYIKLPNLSCTWRAYSGSTAATPPSEPPSGDPTQSCPSASSRYATWTPGIFADGFSYQRWPSNPQVGSLQKFELYSKAEAGSGTAGPASWRAWSFDITSGGMYCCNR